jgi:hypothetical protein
MISMGHISGHAHREGANEMNLRLHGKGFEATQEGIELPRPGGQAADGPMAWQRDAV